ncbi:MAG: hypothetical protein JNG88_18440, partial [Phycisphaerales bacterium]|nr:hypothetical protein [Phycisphaerales bacterium]
AALASNGAALDAMLGSFDAMALYGDGFSLYLFGRSNPLSGGDPLGLDWHHFYPLYLGGGSNGPGIEMTDAEHARCHRTLETYLGRNTPEGQAEIWAHLDDATRREYLTIAAEEAGIDVRDPAFRELLESSYANANHGVPSQRRAVAAHQRMTVPRSSQSRGTRAYVFDAIPGANTTRMLAKGAAIANGILAGAAFLAALHPSNGAIRELGLATIHARGRDSGLSLSEEAFGLMDFYELTGDPFSAGWAWDMWSSGLD